MLISEAQATMDAILYEIRRQKSHKYNYDRIARSINRLFGKGYTGKDIKDLYRDNPDKNFTRTHDELKS
jgi:predicted metal-dependent phosphotriesterase family hydrolase